MEIVCPIVDLVNLSAVDYSDVMHTWVEHLRWNMSKSQRVWVMCGQITSICPVLHTDMWITWVIQVESPAEIKFNHYSPRESYVSQPWFSWLSTIHILMYTGTMIMDNECEPFSILFHAYVALTYNRWVQHLNWEIGFEPKGNQLFNFVCDLSHWVIRGMCQSQSIVASQVSVVISRNHVIMMKRLVEEACIFGIVSAYHSSWVLIIYLGCKRIMFRIYYET